MWTLDLSRGERSEETMMANESSITRFPLDASTLQRLDTLALITRKSMATGRPGRRRSPLAGSSMEFADYRRYTPGDDFRRIDWRAYARLERLFLRVFEAEENITVTVLIDCSDSMQHGTPAKSTLAAREVARVDLAGVPCCIESEQSINTVTVIFSSASNTRKNSRSSRA